MLPTRVDNLLVPVAMSSTYVAMSVLRMVPVWMTTGQIAGLATSAALQQRTTVANLDLEPLPKLLKIQTDPYHPDEQTATRVVVSRPRSSDAQLHPL